MALLQGDDEQLPLAEQVNQPLTEKHFALADRLRGNYDLIVFPESALDTDPEQDPGLRARLVALAKQHDAAVLVNARTPRRRRSVPQHEPAVHARRQARRAPTRSSTSCRSASTCRGVTR